MFAKDRRVDVSDTRPGKSPTISTIDGATIITLVIGKHDGQQIELVLLRKGSGELYAAIKSC